MELGSRLKEARTAKGMSLEEVQASTKIQKRYLQAIEENNFDTLPGKFYTRAFIREYASTVGLNPEEVMEEHREELPSMNEETAIPYTRVQKAKQQTAKASTGKGTSKSSKLFPAIITIALIVVIAFVIYFFTQQLSTPAETEPSSDEPQDEVVISNDEENQSQGDQSAGEGEQSEGDSENAGTDQEADAQKDQPEDKEQSDPQEKPEEPAQAEVQLTQTGSGSFPEHVYQVTGAKEKQITIELSAASYLEVTAPKNGQNLIDPIEYTAADSPLTIDAADYNQVFVKTGAAGSVQVKVDGQPVGFPASISTQKLLINFN